MTQAVTRSLAERLERVRKARRTEKDLPKRMKAFADRIAENYDTRLVTKKERGRASGDEE